MKKNIRKVKKFQKPLICLIGILLVVLGIVIDRFMRANADEITYEYQSNNIGYDSTNNNLTATNVKDAIDELYEKVGQCPKGLECISNENVNKINVTHSTIVDAYTYEENNEETFCVTGEEETCQKTICYLDRNKNACASGTIVNYRVNDVDTIKFHVLHDDGVKMTLQTQRNVLHNAIWYSQELNTSKGPVTIMNQLNTIADSWSNVDPISIASGITEFEGGISTNNNCTKTSCSPADENLGYDYGTVAGTYKARLITLTEAVKAGCLNYALSCPIYMNNFLKNSEKYCRVSGKCTNDADENIGYWTMSVVSSDNALRVNETGEILGHGVIYAGLGARAVVVVNK